MSKALTYKAEYNTLTAIINRNGGRYIASSYKEAATFRKRCYQLIAELRKSGPTPFDDIEMTLPSKGKPLDNIITFRIRAAMPPGQLTDLDGNPLAVSDNMSTTGLVPAPVNLEISDDDFEDIRGEAAMMFDDPEDT